MAGTLHSASAPGPGRSTRSASWWTVAAVVAAAGLITGSVWAALNVLGLTHRPADFPHASVPGSVVIELAEGEQAVVYVEAPSASTARTGGVTVHASNGDPVATHPYPGFLQYDVDGEAGRLGVAVLYFTAPSAGDHTVTAHADTSAPGATRLVVGEDLAHGLVAAVLPPALLALGMLALAGVLAATPGRRSRRSSS